MFFPAQKLWQDMNCGKNTKDATCWAHRSLPIRWDNGIYTEGLEPVSGRECSALQFRSPCTQVDKKPTSIDVGKAILKSLSDIISS